VNPPPKAPHTPPKVAPIAKPAREATGTQQELPLNLLRSRQFIFDFYSHIFTQIA